MNSVITEVIITVFIAFKGFTDKHHGVCAILDNYIL